MHTSARRFVVTYIVFREGSSEVWPEESKKICASGCDAHQGSGKVWRQLHVIHLEVQKNFGIQADNLILFLL